MTRTWFPEAHYMPDGNGGYIPTHRFYLEDPFKLLPGQRRIYPTAGQAIGAARDFLIAAQRPIRAERSSEAPEPANDLGRDEWLAGKDARATEERERAFGTSDKPKHVRGRGAERLTLVEYGRIA